MRTEDLGGGRTACIRGLVTAVTVAALLVAATSANARVSAADRAATHAYLQASYALLGAQAATESSARSAAEAAAAKIGGECKGVLSGAPQADEGLLSPKGPTTPRARGEATRRRDQLATIEYEADEVLYEGVNNSLRGATAAFANAVAPLRWSDSRIAPLVAERVALDEAPTPGSSACADMRAWAASGYRTLSATSKQLRAEQQTRLGRALASASLDDLLKRFEGPSEKALIRRSDTLEGKLVKFYLAIAQLSTHLEEALGEKNEIAEAAEHATVVGRGKTRAGSRFTVKIERPPPNLGAGCHVEASIEFRAPGSSGSGGILSIGGGNSFCLAPRRGTRQVNVSCEEGEGVLQITARLPAGVRRVRVALSDGQTVVSPTVGVPARLGGPAAIYVQSVRGASPRPVSLTELTAAGRAVHTDPLRSTGPCKREARHEPVSETLVQGSTPDGSPFTITATSFGPPGGHSELEFSTQAGLRRRIEERERTPPPPAFHWEARHECTPNQFVLIYGLLKPPGASVLVREPSGLVTLQKVAIPAHLHPGGVLAYGVFATPPSEVIVRRANGSTLFKQSLASANREEAEFCEGYVEG